MMSVEENINKQREYCKEHNLPFFAPSDGYCWSCNRQIFDGSDENGYYSNHHITGCPFCHRSYCD